MLARTARLAAATLALTLATPLALAVASSLHQGKYTPQVRMILRQRASPVNPQSIIAS